MGEIRTIPDVLLTPLSIIGGASGSVMHGLKASDKSFVGFGEAYFSTVEYGVIKPWKRHLSMTLNLIVPVGAIRFVLVDERGSLDKQLFMDVTLSHLNYYRLTVPPKIWVAFQGRSKNDINMLLNIADMEHDQMELERLELEKIPFKCK